MLALILVGFTIIFMTTYFWRIKNLPPGPWGLPVIGYLPWLDPKAPYITLTKLSEKYGSVFGLSLGSIYTVVITDPKIVRKVLAKDATTGRAPLYVTHGIMKGYGLICAEGDLWKDQRKFVHGCLRQFGGSKIGSQREKMQTMILDGANDFTDYVKSLGDKKVILDPLDPLRHSMGSVINEIVFGKSWPREDPTWKWLQHLQEEGTKYIGVAGPLNFLPFLRLIPKFKQTMNFLIEGKIKTHQFYQTLIDEQARIIEEHQKSGDSSSLEISNLIQAFLLERLKRGNSEDVQKFYNDQQFYHLLADVFGAGLDTTLTTLRWYLLYIAVHKTVQNKIRDELKEVLGDRTPELEDLSSLPYLEASICETQRIRSVVPTGIPHGTIDDLEIEGYKIPKSTMILPFQWAIHMNPKYWHEPELFDPSRFLDDEEKVVRPEAFLPFQTGKRMCVGDELARMLLFLFSSTIIQNFHIDIESSENLNLVGDCGITLTPKPHKLIFSVVQ